MKKFLLLKFLEFFFMCNFKKIIVCHYLFMLRITTHIVQHFK